ncbi:hypothetical protein BH20PSE1_BH20PSE1_04590 [soil metagenome]
MKMSLTSAHQLQREVSPLLSSVRLSLLAVSLSGAMGAASAQVDVPDKDAPPIELPVLVVEGKATAADGPLLPSELQVEGPFGDSRTLAETPRAVTSIGSDLIERAALVELNDLQRLVPNSYGANTFGVASLPFFRGQRAEIFQDGLRRQGGNNGLGLPLSLNSFGQIDAIKGPPPVVLGSTQRVGGFVNLIPKRPDLDAAAGSLRLGGGTWDRYRQQLDYSTPIDAGRSAVRLSVENRNEDSFYDFTRYDSQSLFAAYRLQPAAGSVLDVNFEYFNVDFTDNAGWNRPTQDLIDNGIYITGQGVQPNGSTVPGPNAVVSPTGTVRLPRSRVLTDPADRNNSETAIASLRYETNIRPGFKLINRAIYQHLEREEIAQNSFVEIIDGADTFEDRSEFVAAYDLPLSGFQTRHETTFGLDLRYHDIKGFSQFTTEADNPIDLTGPIENRRIRLTPEQRARLVQLRPGVFVSPGAQYDIDGDGVGDFNISDTTDSTTYQAGLFVQQDVQFTPRWNLLVGLRGDWYDVTARDPLPPPGQQAARDSISELLGAANASLSFKPAPDLTSYFAASYSQSTSNSLGGGFVLGADNKISAENFATDSELYEIGPKYAPAGGSWYADLVLFDQTRNLRNRDGSNSGIKNSGIEAQLSLRPDRHWFANLSASYQDTRFDDSAAVQDSRTVLDAFDDSRPDIVVGTGAGSPNLTVFPPSDQRVPGLPRKLVSGLVSYAFDSGIETGVSVVYTDQFPLDFLATVKIREQVTVNAFVAYHLWATDTDFRLEVFNLTDEENFSPIFDGGFFGSTLVLPEEPINVMFTLRQRFAF